MMADDRLTCRDLVELVTDYLELALSPAERARLEDHLTCCPDCPRYLAQMRDTVRLLGVLRVDAVSAGARETLRTAFRGWQRGSNGHHGLFA
jgi:anti-sigma factor RsiW